MDFPKLSDILNRYVYFVLKTHDFNQSKSAEILGVSQRTIRNYITRMTKVDPSIRDEIDEFRKKKFEKVDKLEKKDFWNTKGF